MVIGDLPQMLATAWRRDVVSSGKQDAAFSARHYELLMGMAARGALRAVIDSTFPLENIVEAHRRVDTGHKRGSVIVTVGAS